MPSFDRRQDFKPSCPLGGTWQVCTSGSRFVGCCKSYACGDDSCPTDDLVAASFDSSKWGTFPDQECSVGAWHTCQDSKPPFMGCCIDDPCNEGCPSGMLGAGILSNNPSSAAPFLSSSKLISSSSKLISSSSTLISSSSKRSSSSTTTKTTTRETSATSFDTTSTLSLSFTSTSAPTTSPVTTNPVSKTPVAAIAGGTAGGVAFFAIAVFLLWRMYRHTRISQQEQGRSMSQRLSIGAFSAEKPGGTGATASKLEQQEILTDPKPANIGVVTHHSASPTANTPRLPSYHSDYPESVNNINPYYELSANSQRRAELEANHDIYRDGGISPTTMMRAGSQQRAELETNHPIHREDGISPTTTTRAVTPTTPNNNRASGRESWSPIVQTIGEAERTFSDSQSVPSAASDSAPSSPVEGPSKKRNSITRKSVPTHWSSDGSYVRGAPPPPVKE